MKVKDVRFLPGEHDTGLDEGEAYREFFGQGRYSFDHKGIHFIALDNVSDPRSVIGTDQLEWLRADLAPRTKDGPIVVFTHRPLFDLYSDWDWYTRDGSEVIDALMPFSAVTVFYGHIHQEHHRITGHIGHHAGKGLMYPLPPPGSVPVKSPLPWDVGHPYRGIGFRAVGIPAMALTEYGVKGEKL